MGRNLLRFSVVFVFLALHFVAMGQPGNLDRGSGNLGRGNENGGNPLTEFDIQSTPRGKGVSGYIEIKEGDRLSVANFVRELLKDKPAHKLREKKREKDALGFVHIKYQQYYEDVEVEGGEYILHTQNGYVKSANGAIQNIYNFDVSPSLTKEAALSLALNFLGAEKYKWEIPEEEELLKEMTGDNNKTYYPEGDLVITPIDKEAAFILSYRFDIYSEEPHGRKLIYIDAKTGEVISTLDMICHIDAEGTAHTRYSGVQRIMTDQFSEGYRLRQSARGNGVVTLNMHNGTSYREASDFVNESNVWNNGENENAAYDAHWGTESTYDYFLEKHNRKSYDNEGAILASFVHYSKNYNNAFWNGRWMTYGDGDGVNLSPLTSLDIIGHEIAHGVTNYSANLIYANEPGALNESFSDIFGTAVEFYKGIDANYLIGEKIFIRGGFLRDMANPKRRRHPNTYGGEFWYTGTGDNGGVHINSGVQNHWFYLLSEGGSGVNDLGNEYQVPPIGIEKAAAVAYRNLTVYLTRFSDYQDARMYSILAAEDLFGECSDEVKSVTNAWHAVGVGAPYYEGLKAGFAALNNSSCRLPFTVSFENESLNGGDFHWDFGDGNSSNESHPSHTYYKEGSYSVKLKVNGSVCGRELEDSLTLENFININQEEGPVAESNGRCGPGSVKLSVEEEGMFNWYDTAVGGSPLYSGNYFDTPEIYVDTKFYVERETQPGNVFSEPIDHQFGTGGYHNNSSTQFLIFDCYEPVVLKSVWVNSAASGRRNIHLWDENGALVKSFSVHIPSGTNRVKFDLPIEPGRNYRLGGSYMNLYRNSSGTSYPYNVNNLISVHGSSAGSEYYYYFYNWEIQPQACLSKRSEVVAHVSEQQKLSIEGPTNVYEEEMDIAYNVGKEQNTSYSWRVPEDCEIISGQNTSSIKVNWGDFSGFVNVESLYRGCVSYDSLLVVVKNKLSVSLLYLKAQQHDNMVDLTWSTASQKNTCCFVVEKSFDGESFTAIGEVAALGESSQVNSYDFTDVLSGFQPLRGKKLFYRLKIYDMDGDFDYSPVKIIQPESVEFKAFAYPNPVQIGKNLLIKFDKISDGPIMCHVSDIAGRNLGIYKISEEESMAGFYFDTSSLSSGVYLFRFLNAGYSDIVKIVVQ
ncbi:M4 family metallopeptidase [Cytophagaceae bacterium ABcell3]|nr:M4 family metallopeptidase [Cytophagaceae bacterium ABcell3]